MDEPEVQEVQEPLTAAPPQDTDVASVEPAVDDVLATEELEVTPQAKDAHRATITGLSVATFDTGTKGIKVALYSDDAGFDTDMTVFVPKEYAENIALDPKQLSEEVPEGKKQSPKQRYGEVVSNSKGTATLQQWRALAKKHGRQADAQTAQQVLNKPRPENFEELVALYNYLLSGIQVVMFRKPDTRDDTDPRFYGRLKVGGFMDADEAFKPKALKGYTKMWEQQ